MREKAKIIGVGTFIKRYANPDFGLITTVAPHGWCFDCSGGIPAVDVRDGEIYFAGWTIKELEEIAQRPSEFVEIEMPL